MSEAADNRSGRGGGESSIAGLFRAWLRNLGRGRSSEDASLTDDIEELIEERREAKLPVGPQERLMLINILRFGELRVDEVMVPRADIVAVEARASFDEVMGAFREAGHSRLPIYRDSLDDVIGMVHIKDLFKYWGAAESFALSGVVRKVLFVAPSMPVLDLLMQMQTNHLHLALVVDEYGGTDGLLTIEDLVEQIVGEIEDEYDVAAGPFLLERPDGTLEADARTPVEDLERRLGFNLLTADLEEYVDTLGGLVFSLVGRVPQRGELIHHPSGIEFEVLDADPRRLKRLRVRNLEAAATAES